MAKHSGQKDATALRPVTAQLAELHRLSVNELAEKHRELYGESTRSRNKVQLRKKLSWRIQELAEGGLSERTLGKILELGDSVPTRWGRPTEAATTPAAETTPARDARLPPPGTVLRRTHDGRNHEVTVGADGFTYEGRAYRSLSAVAREITGTPWNGWTFFGLKAESKARAA